MKLWVIDYAYESPRPPFHGSLRLVVLLLRRDLGYLMRLSATPDDFLNHTTSYFPPFAPCRSAFTVHARTLLFSSLRRWPSNTRQSHASQPWGEMQTSVIRSCNEAGVHPGQAGSYSLLCHSYAGLRMQGR